MQQLQKDTLASNLSTTLWAISKVVNHDWDQDRYDVWQL
ncbi:hypothetical protein B6N60_04051 [Richelia sinica FACHB-800]|uniref:Uncharacterized protein n=1 Tax=Richelia sinica FACHB-800 TaxID=1357546 RepID=A0A975TC53_9NOST|nr:hypothetical protein B6N60_04051 [Richelia sinica FACHB-800]